MTILDCEQRSAEWYAARVGVLTATAAAAMLSKVKKTGEEPVGKTRLRMRLALESLYGEPREEPHYESEAMRVGRAREGDARDAYEAVTGEIVQTVGFIRHQGLPIGCSPDGIVGDFDGGLEVKCPDDHTHWQYVIDDRLPPEYLPQVLHSLYVTGLPWWDFCSYCPAFKGALRLFRVRVSRFDVDLDAYALALHLFLGEVDLLKETVRERDLALELAHA